MKIEISYVLEVTVIIHPLQNLGDQYKWDDNSLNLEIAALSRRPLPSDGRRKSLG